jgi:hypothetical protein
MISMTEAQANSMDAVKRLMKKEEPQKEVQKEVAKEAEKGTVISGSDL